MALKQVIYAALTIPLWLGRGSGENMDRFAFAVAALVSSGTLAFAGCEDSKAYLLNEQPLPEKFSEEIEAQNVESADGASFFIYRNKENRPDRILRVDFGEMGRHTAKLVIGAPNDLMITSMNEFYNVPYAIPGSFTVRDERTYYYFCDGNLQHAPDYGSTDDYAKAAREVADIFFKAPEIVKQLKQSGALPPVWK
jgi:hypothetical protein